MRGSVLGRAGRNQEALADFDRAIAIDANYAQAYANRGQVHRQMNRLDLALADYNKALALDQNYAAAYLGRGQVYRAQGRALDALNDYNRAIQMTPEQRAGLLQSRPALSGAGAAQVRDRRFLHRDRADPAAGRALHRARPEPPRARRRQGGGERSRRRRARSSRAASMPGPAAGSPTSGSATRRRPPAPTPRRSTSTRSTSPRRRASPASAARPGRCIRRFDHRAPTRSVPPSPASCLEAAALIRKLARRNRFLIEFARLVELVIEVLARSVMYMARTFRSSALVQDRDPSCRSA